MRYELRELEVIVSVFLKPRLFLTEPPLRSAMDDCLAAVDKEVERIGFALCDGFLNCTADSRDEFVRLHQQGITELLDTLYQYVYGAEKALFEQSSPLYCFRENYLGILARLQGLFEFMQKRFEGYFHPAVKLPIIIWHCNRKIAKHNLKILLSRIQLLNFSEAVIRFLTLPLKDFISRNVPITFGTLSYLRNYQRALNKIFKNEPLYEDVFFNFLININLNSDDFFSYYKSQFINSEKSYTGTGFIQGSIFTALPGPPYLPTLPSLTARIRSLEKSQHKKNMFAGAKDPTEAEAGKNGLEANKLQTSLTVSQISLFIKMMCDSNFIRNKTPIEVITLVASKLRTDTTENLSVHSLLNKYYTIENTTLEKMRNEVKGLQVLLSGYRAT